MNILSYGVSTKSGQAHRLDLAMYAATPQRVAISLALVRAAGAEVLEAAVGFLRVLRFLRHLPRLVRVRLLVR